MKEENNLKNNIRNVVVGGLLVYLLSEFYEALENESPKASLSKSELQARLEEAVAEERYEEAAVLRDKILAIGK
jgi:excinuclease UvrABC helicase subunit UvrB